MSSSLYYAYIYTARDIDIHSRYRNSFFNSRDMYCKLTNGSPVADTALCTVWAHSIQQCCSHGGEILLVLSFSQHALFWAHLNCIYNVVSGSFYVPVQSDQLLYVYINAEIGGQDCLMSNSTLKPCQTLSFVAENMTQRHYLVRIEIVSDRLDLTQPVEFNSWEGLTINGSGTLIHCNGSDAGIAFVNVKDLVIHSVTMTNVELFLTTFLDSHTANETERLNVAIYILNCTDVNISYVDIQDSHGTGLSVYDTNGTVDIAHCYFSNNSVSDSEEGGGGIHIELPICNPGIVGHCSGHNGRNRDSK